MESQGKNNLFSSRPKRVHHVLAHSYLLFFIFLLISITLDLRFPLKLFPSASFLPIGIVLLILSSALIFWAQHTSRKLESGSLTTESFCRGPYRYSRSPTHWGLFLLMFGFGVVVNAAFVVFFTVISFLVTKFFFIREEEKILAQKYGASYLEYQKKVRF